MIKVLIRIEYENKQIMNTVTNNQDWYQINGPIRMNDIYIGEWFDSTFDTDGWLLPHYNYTKNWKKANLIINPTVGILSSSAIMPKSKKLQSYTPIAITEPSYGIFVVDFGQNVLLYYI